MPNASTSSRPRRKRWPLIAAALVTIALVVVVIFFTQPLPPRTVVMATGPAGGAYDAFSQRYREVFAGYGITLELRQTNGSIDNLELLRDPGSGVSVALVQGGMTNPDESPALASLGTLFYEPFWMFSRVGTISSDETLRDGMRISLGQPGSGTYVLGRRMAALVGLNLDHMQVSDVGSTEAGEALMRGELDFIGMSLAWEHDIVQRLLRDPAIEPFDATRADAWVALHPYLSKRSLPRGVADLANDLPARDITLIGSDASLIVREDLHPALQYLLLEAASRIHGKPGVFNRAGEFPAAEPIDLPLSDVADNYYRSGKPLLQRYLPFWLAAYATRLIYILIPLLGVAYPLFRLLPALYGWSMRRRILRLYGELKLLEADLDMNSPAATAEALQQLDRLERRVSHMRVTTAFNQMLYTLKQHIGLVRERIARPASNAESPRPGDAQSQTR